MYPAVCDAANAANHQPLKASGPFTLSLVQIRDRASSRWPGLGKERDMSAFYKVMRLSVFFLYEIERAMPVVNEVNRAIKRWCRPAMAGKRAVDFVIVTDETSEQLVKRLRPALNEITTILDYRCQTCIDDVVGKEAIDVFGTYVAEAWQELRKRNDPKYVRQPERAETLVIGNMENLDRGTAIKMGIKARRPRKAPQKPDRP